MSDYTVGDTLHFMFTTRRFTTGAPYALASGVISAYENEGLTQITAGVTLGADHDGVTGLNLVTVVASGANGFETGKDYNLVITTGTVDSVSVVGEVVGRFTLSRSAAAVDLANATDGLGAIKAETALILADTGTDGVVVAAGSKTGYTLTATTGLGNQTADITGTITTTTNLTNERGKYAMGAVWVGPTANTNTVSYVDGIITNPVSTIAAAKTIADALNLRRFYTIRSGTTQIGAAMAGYDFDGSAWTCTTTGGSRDVGTSSFHHAIVTAGTFAGTTGSIWWDNCEFSTGISIGISNLWNCTFAGTTTLLEAGNYDFVDCASIVAGTAAPEFAVPAGTVNISFRRWSGGIKLTGLTAGTTVSIDIVSGGTVTLEGTAATVVIRGMATGVTNSMAPNAGTVTQTAVVNQGAIADAVWDEATAGHTTAGSTGKAVIDILEDTSTTLQAELDGIQADTEDIQTRIPAALSSGNMKVDVLAISGSTTAADNLEESTEAIVYGTCNSGGNTTTIITKALTMDATIADQFKGRVLIFKTDTATAALQGQATTISSHTFTSAEVITMTVVALTSNPADNDTFVIL